MSILLLEGFDHITELSYRYNGVGVNSANAYTVGTPARTGRALRLMVTSANGVQFFLRVNPAVIYTGFAFQADSLPQYPYVRTICSFYQDDGNKSSSLDLKSDGTLVFRGATSNLASTGVGIISTNIWHYIEIKSTISDTITTDDCIVKLDGTEILNPASGDTRYSWSTKFASVRLSGIGTSTRQTFYDDFWIDDAQFLGQVKIATLVPSAQGTALDFVGSDGDSIDNYLLVDEMQDDVADYVDGVSLDKDSYNFTLPAGTILGLVTEALVKKSLMSGALISRLYTKQDSVWYGTNHSTPENWGNIDHIWENNPKTAAPWTSAEIEFGLEVI